MAERFGARLKYEDELAAEMRQCEEQLELMYLKRRQRKQQRDRDEKQRLKEEEERRARKAAKIEEERRVKRHERELMEIEEAIQHREREYTESKRLDTIKLRRMKEEMEKIQAELREVTSKRDRTRKVREMKRREVDLDDGQDEHPKPVPSNVQSSPHLNKDHLCHEHEKSELCSTDVLDARINSNDTTMTQADVSQTNAAPVEAAAHPAILDIPDSQDATVCLLDVSQNMNRSTIEQVVQPVVSYLPEPHDQFDHTVQMFRLYCFSCTSVNKIFYCVSLCLLYVLYCSIVLRYCTYLNPCSV